MSHFGLRQCLNDSLLNGKQMTRKLWGLVRHIQSDTVALLRKRDEAEDHLMLYVDRLLECLLDFRSQMLESIKASVKQKQDKLREIKKKYEDDIYILINLVEETEKLDTFGKSVYDVCDKEKARSLLEAFEVLLQRRPENCRDQNLDLLELKTSVELEEITPEMFGHVITDASQQTIEQQFCDEISSVLSGHANRQTKITTKDANTQTSCGVNKDDRSTQTPSRLDTDSHISQTVTPPPGLPDSSSPMSVTNDSPTPQTRANIPVLYMYGINGCSQPLDTNNNDSNSKPTYQPPDVSCETRDESKFPLESLHHSLQSTTSLDTSGNSHPEIMDISLPNTENCVDGTGLEDGHRDVCDTQAEPLHTSCGHTPPPVPDIVKNLLKKRMSSDRKPLRRPFTAITKDNSFQHHSTPIKVEKDEENIAIIENSANSSAEVLDNVQIKMENVERNTMNIEGCDNWDDEISDNLQTVAKVFEKLCSKTSPSELTTRNSSDKSHATFQAETCCNQVADSFDPSPDKKELEPCVKATPIGNDTFDNVYSTNKDDSGISVHDRSKSDQMKETESPTTAISHTIDNPKESRSKSRRMGALQKHWLSSYHGEGTYADMDAKFEFEFCCNFHFPIGLATNSSKQIIVADTGNHVVKMFDETGHLICEIGNDQDMRRPSAIVVNEEDEMFVKDDICIRKFDRDGSHIKDFGKYMLKKPFGLAMTPANNLLVLDTNFSKPCLVHISQDGKTVNFYKYQPLIYANPRSKCRFLGVSDNSVIVSDLGMSEVYITTLEGLYLAKLGTYGNGLMQFVEPSGIAVDNYGNVLIGDSKNNRIQMYRSDGTYIGLLSLDKPIGRPSGLHLTADNKLMVVNFLHHHIKVFQL